jgi:hypothetical protein
MPNLSVRWRSRPDISKLETTIDRLQTENIRLRDQLRAKQTALGGLELALQARHETIDDLVGKLEQVRAQNRRLDAEAERLAEMVRLS